MSDNVPLSRRRFLGTAGAAGAAAVLAGCGKLLGASADEATTTTAAPTTTTEAPTTTSAVKATTTSALADKLPRNAAEALQQLLDGNARYVAGKPKHPHEDAARRAAVAQAQHPIAIVLGCADSRVAPEVLFDQGLGDLFVVRTAGEVVDQAVLGTIEYGAEHLEIPLVVVLGHERCGAVKTTLELLEKGGEAPSGLATLVRAITPAAESAKGAPDPLDAAMRANVDNVVAQLRASAAILGPRVAEKKLAIVGAAYDLDDGRVTLASL